jgi:imidazolonepropionase-like amidohydrolase
MATVNGAKLIRKETSLGRVQPGFEADLIAIRGNPLENVRLLADPQKNLAHVMKGGRLVERQS